MLAALRARWFEEVVRSARLRDKVEGDLAVAVGKLQKAGVQVTAHVVDSEGSAETFEKRVRSEGPDLVVVLFQVWAEDGYLVPIVRTLRKHPWALWLYRPGPVPPFLAFEDLLRYSGTVGTLQGLGLLHHLIHGAEALEARPFAWIVGDPALAAPALLDLALAARVVRELDRMRIGLVPGPNPQMLSTYVNEAGVTARWGAQVERASVTQLAERVQHVRGEDVDDFMQQLSLLPWAGVSEEVVRAAARASLGLSQLTLERGWQVVSLNDIDEELHRTLGLRPCLYPPPLRKRGVVVGLEGDLGAALSMAILRRLSGGPTLFLEVFTWDEEANVLLAGHAGVQDDAAADESAGMELLPDLEFRNSDPIPGVWLSFAAKPGPVTLLQIRATPDGFQSIVVEGYCVGGPRRIEGYPHAAIRLDVPVLHLFEALVNTGSTQHWAMAYGHWARTLVHLHRWIGLPVRWVRKHQEADPSHLWMASITPSP